MSTPKCLAAQRAMNTIGGAAITFPHARQVVLTDSSGHFGVRTSQAVTHLLVSRLGYRAQAVPVAPGGQLLTIAILWSLVCTLVVLPNLLTLRRSWSAGR